MSEAKDCPRCGLVNPPEAQRCDCGYDFAAGRFVGSLLPHAPPGKPRLRSWEVIVLGCLLVPAGAVVGAAIGVPVSLLAAQPAPPDACGLYAFGPAVLGFVRGALFGGLAGFVVLIVKLLRP